MARSTMAGLIQTVRGFANIGTADYALGTVNYWSDDQIQEVLDRWSYEIRNETLTSFPVTVSGGSVQWRDYQSQFIFYETSDGGTARFIVQDTTGGTITSYTANYQKGLITFNQNTGGTVYELTGFAYDVYGAAGDIWNQKSGAYAGGIDFKTDNHEVKRSHVLKNMQSMAKKYEAMSGIPYQSSSVATIFRGDTIS